VSRAGEREGLEKLLSFFFFLISLPFFVTSPCDEREKKEEGSALGTGVGLFFTPSLSLFFFLHLFLFFLAVRERRHFRR